MSIRAAAALTVDVVLGSVLGFLYANHGHLAIHTRDGAVEVPDRWLYAAVFLIVTAVTALWLFGPRSQPKRPITPPTKTYPQRPRSRS